MIVTVIIPTNTPSKGTLKTFLRMINSGSDRAVTAIIKASTVPMLIPFSINAYTIGMTPLLRIQGYADCDRNRTAKGFPFPA